jgi:hypothetical protein
LRDTYALDWEPRKKGDLQALPGLFECSEHLSENRGVPGSSPGLAISKREIPHGC